MNFDHIAKSTISNLSEVFGKSYTIRPDIICDNSVGLELEIKFKFLFPDLHEKYFMSNVIYSNFSEEKKNNINAEIFEQEKNLLPLFEKTLSCGIPKGLDKYWEFSFNPVNNLTLLIYQIDILKQVGLIPKGNHSLHITIGDSKASPNMYWILLTLELLYCSKERIKSGFSSKGNTSATWAKKGEGGIMAKNRYDLVDSESGFEYRTLQFDGDIDKLYGMFSLFIRLLNDKKILTFVKNEVLNLGLPNENWGKPHLNPIVWNTYIANFDELSNNLKKHIC